MNKYNVNQKVFYVGPSYGLTDDEYMVKSFRIEEITISIFNKTSRENEYYIRYFGGEYFSFLESEIFSTEAEAVKEMEIMNMAQ
jgi:hypothetical protein